MEIKQHITEWWMYQRRNLKSYLKNVRTRWEWKYNTAKPLDHSKNSPNRGIYSSKILEGTQINYLMMQHKHLENG